MAADEHVVILENFCGHKLLCLAGSGLKLAGMKLGTQNSAVRFVASHAARGPRSSCKGHAPR